MLPYKRIIVINENGLIYKNKEYSWSEVKEITRFDSHFYTLFFFQYGYPLSIIRLKDGNKIYLHGRVLHEEGKKDEWTLFNTTKAYKKLMTFIESKINQNKA